MNATSILIDRKFMPENAIKQVRLRIPKDSPWLSISEDAIKQCNEYGV